jgi:hypothetical protein
MRGRLRSLTVFASRFACTTAAVLRVLLLHLVWLVRFVLLLLLLFFLRLSLGAALRLLTTFTTALLPPVTSSSTALAAMWRTHLLASRSLRFRALKPLTFRRARGLRRRLRLIVNSKIIAASQLLPARTASLGTGELFLMLALGCGSSR